MNPAETTHGRVAAWLWHYKREVLATLVVAATCGLVFAVPVTRRWTIGFYRAARTRRLLLDGFAELKVANARGRMPRIRRVEATPFGERVHLRGRAGHWGDLLTVRIAALTSALRASEVRIDVDKERAQHITVDVVRRDPFRNDVGWADAGADRLSIWDPVHLGLTEMGEPLRVTLPERSILAAGNPGSGKSTFMRTVLAHAAMSRDAHLVLIDPNKVQFTPWRARATGYAAEDQDDALRVLVDVQREMQRRLDWLSTLPGSPEKVTREIAVEHGLSAYVVMVDELAYHTSIAQDGAKRAAFSALVRDIVARGRAALVIPVIGTQRPTDKVVPRELSELFAMRIAFRTATSASSDVILGDGTAKKGWDASKIPLTSRGVGLLLGEDPRPVRIKGARIAPEAVAGIAASSVSLKPTTTPLLAAA